VGDKDRRIMVRIVLRITDRGRAARRRTATTSLNVIYS
jgi:hypothetical protein